MNTKPFVWDFRGRRSIRLRDKDYSAPGDYFVTICTNDRECFFSSVTDGRMMLNASGRMVKRCWTEVTDWFPMIVRGPYVIMPNHFHAIITIRDSGIPEHDPPPSSSDARDTDAPVGAQFIAPRNACDEPAVRKFGPRPRGAMNCAPTVADVIRRFKAKTSYALRRTGTPSFAWQRNYWESCLNTERQYANVEEYIINNPAAWESDELNPAILHP